MEETGFICGGVARTGLHGRLQTPTWLFVVFVGRAIELLSGSIMWPSRPSPVANL